MTSSGGGAAIVAVDAPGGASAAIDAMVAEGSTEGLVGQGGSSRVHRATHPVSGVPVAVKVSRPGRDPGTGMSNRGSMRAEAEILRQVTDPHVVTLVDHDDDGTTARTVLVLAEGGALRDRLAVGAAPTPDGVTVLGRALRDGLGAIHRLGQVHRDVTPANILLHHDDPGLPPTSAALVAGGERPVLCDLGIAVRSSAHGGAPPSARVGTPLFRAPEQVSGDGTVDATADVHAATAVIVTVLSGRLPPAPEELDDLVATLSPRWRTFVATGMHRSPSGRFPTMDEWHQGLVRALDPED